MIGKGFLSQEIERVSQLEGPRVSGRVTQVIGLLIESQGPAVFVGEICHVYGKKRQKILCQVVGFKDQKVLLMAFGEGTPIAPGAEVYPTGLEHMVPVSNDLEGRVLDALGTPIDGKGDLLPSTFYPVSAPPPHPLKRQLIEKPLNTGIKSLDGLCTLGKGQRVGIFSGPGVGKSTLMGMIAKMALADVNVIALVGERGREVRDFIEKDLGPEGLARSVIIVATSDQGALLRSKAANVATAIAEYFRDQGKNVVLMMDSVSRYAMALREIGLAIGEPPTTQGYTPSVFAKLPQLLERAGQGEKGSITGIYTILSEEDQLHDPIAEQVQSLLDGHLHLSRSLAAANHFPPVDVLKSLSRLMPQLVSESHLKWAAKCRKLLHTYKEGEELIQLGAYVAGSNPLLDEAIQKQGAIQLFLQQGNKESFPFKEIVKGLEKALKEGT